MISSLLRLARYCFSTAPRRADLAHVSGATREESGSVGCRLGELEETTAPPAWRDHEGLPSRRKHRFDLAQGAGLLGEKTGNEDGQRYE